MEVEEPALCSLTSVTSKLWRDKVKFTMNPCSHQDPREGQGRGKPPGFLSACLLSEWLCDLKPCPRFSDDQPPAQSLATLRVGVMAFLAKGRQKSSSFQNHSDCWVPGVFSGICMQGDFLHSCGSVTALWRFKRIWFFAGISPAEFSNWDIPLVAVGHTIEYH